MRVLCQQCGGAGHVWPTNVDPETRADVTKVLCTVCAGRGSFRRPRAPREAVALVVGVLLGLVGWGLVIGAALCCMP